MKQGRAPILLLDEIAAHLDAKRRAALFEEILALGAQAWMTGTDIEMFATLKTKPGKADTFERLLSELAVPTRAEPGTKLYVFGRAPEPDTFVMMERYDDKNALKAHYSSAHFQRLAPQLAECLDGEPSSASARTALMSTGSDALRRNRFA